MLSGDKSSRSQIHLRSRSHSRSIVQRCLRQITTDRIVARVDRYELIIASIYLFAVRRSRFPLARLVIASPPCNFLREPVPLPRNPIHPRIEHNFSGSNVATSRAARSNSSDNDLRRRAKPKTPPSKSIEEEEEETTLIRQSAQARGPCIPSRLIKMQLSCKCRVGTIYICIYIYMCIYDEQ